MIGISKLILGTLNRAHHSGFKPPSRAMAQFPLTKKIIQPRDATTPKTPRSAKPPPNPPDPRRVRVPSEPAPSRGCQIQRTPSARGATIMNFELSRDARSVIVNLDAFITERPGVLGGVYGDDGHGIIDVISITTSDTSITVVLRGITSIVPCRDTIVPSRARGRGRRGWRRRVVNRGRCRCRRGRGRRRRRWRTIASDDWPIVCKHDSSSIVAPREAHLVVNTDSTDAASRLALELVAGRARGPVISCGKADRARRARAIDTTSGRAFGTRCRAGVPHRLAALEVVTCSIVSEALAKLALAMVPRGAPQIMDARVGARRAEPPGRAT